MQPAERGMLGVRTTWAILLDYMDEWAPGAEAVQGPRQGASFLGAQMVYPGQTDFCPDILYVLPDRETAAPSSDGDITFLSCGADPAPVQGADTILLRCPQTPPQLCAGLSAFLRTLNEWENSLNLAILDNCTGQDLIDRSEDLLRNPVILQDSNFQYLAGTKGVTEVDEYYRQLQLGRDPTSDVVMSLMQNRQNDSTVQFGRFPTGQKYHVAVGPTREKYKEIYVDLEAGGNNVMSVHMCLSQYPPTDGLLQIFGIFCDKLRRLRLLRSGGRNTGGVAINDYIFGRLIAGDDNALSMAQCDGLSPDQTYVIAAVESTTIRALLKHINTVLPGGRAFLYQQQIYIYFPIDPDVPTSARSPERQEQQLRAFGEQHGILIAQSGPFHSLRQVGDACAQAARTLSLFRRLNPDDKDRPALVCYRDMVRWDLVDCYSQNNPIDSFAPASYLQMKEGDRKNNMNNCYVARIYIENGCSVAQTAKQLFMHKNSVLYRIERIKNLYGIDFSDRQENQLFLLAGLAQELETSGDGTPPSQP